MGIATRIRFLAFDGCPHAGLARDTLIQALEECGLTNRDFLEIDILGPGIPDDISAWGSPTILVDGKDVSGTTSGDAASCRIYATPEKVPDKSHVVAAIRMAIGA